MKVCWNSCKENGRIWFSLRWRWVFTCVKSCCHQCETTVSNWWSNSIYRKFTHWHPIKLNESTAYPVRFNLISALLLQITGECSTPSLTYRFGGITDFLHGKLLVMSGMKWRKNFMFYVRRSYLLSVWSWRVNQVSFLELGDVAVENIEEIYFVMSFISLSNATTVYPSFL